MAALTDHMWSLPELLDVAARAGYRSVKGTRRMPNEVPSPTLLASQLHRIDRATALSLVEQHLGAPDEWESGLIRYRFSSEFQSDFKAEIGHWLHTADREGYRDALLQKVLGRAKKGTRSVGVDPNDKKYGVLLQELAPATTTHYLCGTGWRFVAWEPCTGGAIDIDLGMTAPDGTPVSIQVKSPDQLGRIVDHRIMDGEYDERVLIAVTKAAAQLPTTGPEGKIVVVCANRQYPLPFQPQCLVIDLIGGTLSWGAGITTLPYANRGKFWKPEWEHVSAVVMLNFFMAGKDPQYPCTVLVNPNAAVAADPSWFPNARVCVLDDTTFRWVGGAPGVAHTIPDGTTLETETVK